MFLQSHNDYLQVIFEYGYLGVAIVGTVLGAACVHLWKYWLRAHNKETPIEVRGAQAMLCGFLVNAIGNFPFQLAPHFFLATLCLAVILKYSREKGTLIEWL